MAVAGAGARAKLWPKSEPEPKINNFGSVTLVVNVSFYLLNNFSTKK